jgi:hypothetical protein
VNIKKHNCQPHIIWNTVFHGLFEVIECLGLFVVKIITWYCQSVHLEIAAFSSMLYSSHYKEMPTLEYVQGVITKHAQHCFYAYMYKVLQYQKEIFLLNAFFLCLESLRQEPRSSFSLHTKSVCSEKGNVFGLFLVLIIELYRYCLLLPC